MDRRTALRTLAAAGALPLFPIDELEALVTARQTLHCARADANYKSAALDARQLEIVRTVADIILPSTDSPSASEVGVHQFIDVMVSEWLDEEEVALILQGLEDLDGEATTRFGREFLECDVTQQTQLVDALDLELDQLRETDAEVSDTFFHWMKRLTLTGYFTSEEGMAALEYRRIPGAFEGCVVGGPA